LPSFGSERQEGGGNDGKLTLLEAISLVSEGYALKFRGVEPTRGADPARVIGGMGVQDE
jgi:hypothetical protein